jgi:hypothetical protein
MAKEKAHALLHVLIGLAEETPLWSPEKRRWQHTDALVDTQPLDQTIADLEAAGRILRTQLKRKGNRNLEYRRRVQRALKGVDKFVAMYQKRTRRKRKTKRKRTRKRTRRLA